MAEPAPPRPFFLVTYEDRGVLSVEGPMSDEAPGAPPPDRQQRQVTFGPDRPGSRHDSTRLFADLASHR
jgi:hypothetical protein